MANASLGPESSDNVWIKTPEHRAWLMQDAQRQFAFFRASLRPEHGFYTLALDGRPRDTGIQELHSSTRMVHSYALGKLAGIDAGDDVIDQGLRYILSHHRDAQHGGFLWGLDGDTVQDARKLAYGHVFVLLAAASAHAAGHPDAMALLDEVETVLDRHFWEDGPGLFSDEWNRDWTPFSTYRGMNANMHGVEALMAAYEASGREKFLTQAGRILSFFMGKMAPAHNWRVPEHYTKDWQVDPTYSGDPMFRPAGTTPGHSVEWARLWLQYGALAGQDVTEQARQIVYRALQDAWDHDRGGLVYTLDHAGQPAIRDRYWWPVTEAIGVLAALTKTGGTAEDEIWYRKLWRFAEAHLVDHQHGGWFPELDAENQPTDRQFAGKPDIYHSVQATLLPLTADVSGVYDGLRGLRRPKL